ncbi:MAG: GDP-L-fucose synthase [Verrucomicrobia bacterium]|nr:GDP-L-fucose synthase [Verrucomicrobiota bacterium]
MELAGKRVLVTGGSGFVGSNLIPLLKQAGAEVFAPTRQEYNLLRQEDVSRMFSELRPEVVFHLAAYVGGILANRDKPADFCYRNLILGAEVIHHAHLAGVQKYITLMGGCSYPAEASSPIDEMQLWRGYPQPESAPYSLAKAMGYELAKAYRRQYGLHAIVLVPGNIYGPFDNFDLESSHVIPALIRKYHEAKEQGKTEVVAWGSGKPLRDFIYIGDVCEAVILAARNYDREDLINISSGQRVSIRNLVELIAELTGFTGKVVWDSTKPDGQFDKGFSVERMNKILGFRPKTSLLDGLQKTIEWFRINRGTLRELQ